MSGGEGWRWVGNCRPLRLNPAIKKTKRKTATLVSEGKRFMPSEICIIHSRTDAHTHINVNTHSHTHTSYTQTHTSYTCLTSPGAHTVLNKWGDGMRVQAVKGIA